jgi:transglutaminase-like putative cysteine protease
LRLAVRSARTVSLWERYVSGDGLTLTLAGLVVLAVAYPIQEADWVAKMPPLTFIGLLSLGTAALLHYFHVRTSRALPLTFVVGVVVVWFSAVSMSPGAFASDRVANLLTELDFWFDGVFTDEIRGGLIEFGIFLLTVTWWLGFLAGWLALRRHQGYIAVAIGGTVLSIALANVTDNAALWLALFMVASVLLLIHMATAQRMAGWRSKRLSFDPSTVLSQSGILLTAGVLIVVLVTVLPTPKLAPLRFIGDALEERSRTAQAHFARLFNGLPSRRDYRTLTFGEEIFFRGNPNLTDELLFTVTGSRPGYWRARTYTTYTSMGWDTVDAEFTEFEPSGAEDLSRVRTSHGFRIAAATDTFFTAGLPAKFDRPVEALTYEDSPADALQVRFTEGRDFFPTRTNLRYLSFGNESAAEPDDLRDAGTEYPPEIMDRYLQLPPTLTQRVRDLAADVVEGVDNRYDQVETIRQFVQSFPYTLEIDAPPLGQDGVDYFLFDLQRGYCDYYTSATAVLLRTLGIPSRYVLGYASGQWNAATRSYQVLDLNYHSWVEAYFPEYGWIIFEATPPDGIEFGGDQGAFLDPLTPEIDFGSGEVPEDEEDELAGTLDFDANGDSRFSAGNVALGAMGLLAAFLAIVYYRWWFRLRRLSRADELYAKMQRLAALLGAPARPEQTPGEYAEALGEEIPGSARDFHVIARLFANRRYSGKPVPMGDLRLAEESWSRLRWVLIKRLFRLRPA